MDKKTRKIEEAAEILDTIGQRNEKQGIKWTQYFMDLWDKKQFEENQLERERLKKNRIKRREYHRILRNMFDEKVKALDRPNFGYWVETGFNPKGIWVKLHDRFKRVWARGIRPCGTPKIDLHAVNLLVGLTEDKMYEVEDKAITETGIFLPPSAVL